MSWSLPRILARLLATLLGGGAGLVIGDLVQAPLFGVLVGSCVGVLLIGLRDGLRGYRLISWLRGTQDDQAPRDAGFWGEIGYRVERAIRLRERDTVQEQIRLKQFRSAIEASPNGVLMLDAGDQIEWCNPVAADQFGLDPRRDIRQPITNLVRAPAFVDYMQAGEFDEAVDIPGPHGDGTLSVMVRRYGEGQKLVLSQDITERERSERMRRNFVANASHEIRTPLTVLCGFIETMSNLQLSEAEQRHVLTLMSQQAQRMQALVSDLLMLAMLEGSPRPAPDQWITVSKLLAQVKTDATTLSSGRHQLHFADELSGQIAGTETELLSAVGNLVNNAVRYTPEGGTIDVTWRLRPDGTGEIAVTDNGPGIEREHLPRLTERFYRVDSSRSRDTGGTGLGLSIVKHVVQRHGGELEIQSEPGAGSSFKLVLPAARLRA
ncbi:MAG: phosphate regulon sensor histidine kinase PhoR [Burkholderiaceae bacterium]|nr:phosphate regulon sensor histidine kinase PhoR [Burkholderiaceae bacterium]